MASAGALRRMAATKAAGERAVRTSAAPCARATHSVRAAAASATSSIPNSDFGECYGAHIEQIERVAATNSSTLRSGLGRRSSERIFVSSSHPVTR